jgi:hypothetical protein
MKYINNLIIVAFSYKKVYKNDFGKARTGIMT